MFLKEDAQCATQWFNVNYDRCLPIEVLSNNPLGPELTLGILSGKEDGRTYVFVMYCNLCTMHNCKKLKREQIYFWKKMHNTLHNDSIKDAHLNIIGLQAGIEALFNNSLGPRYSGLRIRWKELSCVSLTILLILSLKVHLH
jgi:hypothetical protein